MVSVSTENRLLCFSTKRENEASYLVKIAEESPYIIWKAITASYLTSELRSVEVKEDVFIIELGSIVF